MSGVEIVGLLASASQLALYTIKITTSISEIYHRVQDAPQRIQQHAQQIYELLDTARLIEEHRLLQTDSILAHVNSTLTEAKILFVTLDKVKRDYVCGPSIRRYWKVLKGSNEKDILASFKRLEQEKSALLLCISVAHTDLLGNIQNHHYSSSKQPASVMAEPRRAKSTVSPDSGNPISFFGKSCAVLLGTSDRVLEDLYHEADFTKASETSLAKEDDAKRVDDVSRAEDITHDEFQRTTIEHGRTDSERLSAQTSIHHPPLVLQNPAREQARDNKTQAVKPEDQNRASGCEGPGHLYNRVTAAMEAHQINGNAGKSDGSKHGYNNMRAMDNSRQLNGNMTDPAFLKFYTQEPLKTQ